MKTFWVLLVTVTVLGLGTAGCKKRDVKPAPQVVGTMASVAVTRPPGRL